MRIGNMQTSRRTIPMLVMTGALVVAVAVACGGSSSSSNAGGGGSSDDNGLACDSARRHISEVASTFTDLGKGTITIQDALGPIKKAQSGLEGDASFAHGDVQSTVQAVADSLGRVRVAMADGDMSGASTEEDTTLKTMTSLNTTCSSLGH